jgi:hypothetical protein
MVQMTNIRGRLGGNPTSHIPAHELLVVAAPLGV